MQTQVLPYLRELRKPGVETRSGDEGAWDGTEVSLLTFEPKRAAEDVEEFVTLRAAFAAEGIEWDWLPYHKRPSAVATAWDVFRGAWFIWRRIGRYDVLHGRVHVPTLMGALARRFSRRQPKLLFDIRGFFPEEFVDAGTWPEGGWLFRAAKRVEKWLLRKADGFVVLTEKARQILFPESTETGFDKEGRPVEVIPCCVDLDQRFSGESIELRRTVRKELEIEDRYVIIHVGALGGLYLSKEIADLLAAARKKNPSTFALFLTQSDPVNIEPLLAERGFGADDYFISKVPPDEIEGYLCASDVGLSIVKASFATLSRSPTKIPEYLACGLPIIANSGVGDVDELVQLKCVGALVTEFSDEAYPRALAEVETLGDVSERCREVARQEFDLEAVGGERYRRLYRKLVDL